MIPCTGMPRRHRACSWVLSQFLLFACLVQVSSARGVEVRQRPADTATASSFLRRAYQASAVVGDFLYMDGGTWSSYNDGESQIAYANTLLSIDLSKNWTNSTVAFQSTNKPSGVPNLNFPSLWYHASENALYSGFTGATTFYISDPPTLPKPSIWKFALDGAGGGTYTPAVSSSDSRWSALSQTTPTNSLQAFGPSNAWVLGGNNQDVNEPLPGLVQFDMSSLQFTNHSGAPYDKIGGVQDGSLTYVPLFGQDGIFIAMGGMTSHNTTGLHGFDYVSVFDPTQQQWYNQSTTGTPPSPRIDFCTAGINSTNGTYEIFVYAGWGTHLGQAAVPYDTINILTLPAFHWTSVVYEPANPRHGHSCNAVGGSQIISIGGVDSNCKDTVDNVVDINISTFNSSADPFTQGLAIFDMTTLAWAEQYTANQKPYEQSDPIKQFYSASNGNYRENLNPDVAALVNHTNFTPPSAAMAPTPAPTVSSTQPHSYTAVIAGATAGGVVAIAALSATALFCLRRRQQRRGAPDEASQVAPADKWAPTGPSAYVHEAPSEPSAYLQEAPSESSDGMFELEGQNNREYKQYVYEMPRNEVLRDATRHDVAEML